MPELPDVAGFKRYLDATSLHQKVARSEVTDERFIKGVSRQGLQRRLKGARLQQSKRWGKWLLVELNSGGYLVLHFGMTGQLEYRADEGDLPEHTRLALHFENDKRLCVISQRMIGQASWTSDIEQLADEHDLGPDALEVDTDDFVERLSSRGGSIKSALMNQSIVAGIGNVYSDEILFQAGLHPASKVNELDADTLRKLHKKMRHILRTAGKKGGNGQKAPRGWLLGKRGPKSPCPKCSGGLSKTTINGRTAWFCPQCQTKP